MLILTRRVGEALMVGDDTKIVVLGVKGSQIRLGSNAPKDKLSCKMLKRCLWVVAILLIILLLILSGILSNINVGNNHKH